MRRGIMEAMVTAGAAMLCAARAARAWVEGLIAARDGCPQKKSGKVISE